MKCENCEGEGYFNIFGVERFDIENKYPDCNGTGKAEEILKPCPMCKLEKGKQSVDQKSPIQPYHIIQCEVCGYYISGFRKSELVKLWNSGETNE